jgi:hypothetical protein
VRTFADNWTGTGAISGVGDAEIACLNEGEYLESEVVNTGVQTVVLAINQYAAGDTVLIRYRHGATEVACLAAAWNDYTIPFVSLGYVQVRIESTL